MSNEKETEDRATAQEHKAEEEREDNEDEEAPPVPEDEPEKDQGDELQKLLDS